jgi:hypothetical protein
MLFYILLVFLLISLFVINYYNDKFENPFSLILLVVMIFVGGFRDHIGWDYNMYVTWYINKTRDENVEFGFLSIMKIFRYLNLHYTFLFFFFSFFTYLFGYLAIKKYTKKTLLPLILYFLIPVLFLQSFTYIRQFLSVTIAFYAFSLLLERKYLSYLLLMMLGIVIHYSCLIPFIVFFIIFRWAEFLKISYLYVLMGASFIISQVGFISLLSILFKNSHYFYYVSECVNPVPLAKLLILNIVGLTVIWYYNKYGFQLLHQKYLVTTYICSIIIINLLSESVPLTRIYIYFRIFEIILVSEIIYHTLIKRKIVLLSFLCCFYLFPFFRAITIDKETAPENLKLIPYKSLLFKDQKTL